MAPAFLALPNDLGAGLPMFGSTIIAAICAGLVDEGALAVTVITILAMATWDFWETD